MSRIEEMIKSSKGDWETKTLGEIGTFTRGNGLQKSDFREQGFPCIHYGQIHTFYGTSTNKTISFCEESYAKKLRKAQKGDLLIATTSEDVEACCKAVVWLGDGEVAYSTDSFCFSHNQNPKYMAYLFQTEMFAKNKRKAANGAKVIRVSGESMAKFSFVFPPLAIQQEIVSVLDSFTTLIDKMKKEVELRKKQMEWYRERLMTPKDDWETKTLGEIGTFARGNGLQKSDFREQGFPCIHYGQIHTYYGTSTSETISFCEESFAKRLRKAQKGDLLIATTSEDVEACCKAVVWLGDGDVAYSTDSFCFSHNQNPKYMAYLFQTEMFAKNKRKAANGAKVIRVSGESMATFSFGFPPLSIQQEIVTTLDTFESYITKLERMISLREKQYEYYREKLLSFE